MTLTELILATAKAAHQPSGEPCFEDSNPLPPPRPEKVTEEEHARRMANQRGVDAMPYSCPATPAKPAGNECGGAGGTGSREVEAEKLPENH
jgi:hypothetical protein